MAISSSSVPISRKVVSEALGALRCRIGADLNLYSCQWAPLWVVDFPMFETSDGGRAYAATPPIYRAILQC